MFLNFINALAVILSIIFVIGFASFTYLNVTTVQRWVLPSWLVCSGLLSIVWLVVEFFSR